MNFVAKRTLPVREDLKADADDMQVEPKEEPIYVVFATSDDKMGIQSLEKIIQFMSDYSKEHKNSNTEELLRAILITKSSSSSMSSLARKVRLLFLTCAETK